MKEVRVCEAMKSPVGTLSDGTVLHQQDGGTKSRQVPSLKVPTGDFIDSQTRTSFIGKTSVFLFVTSRL